MTVTSIAEMSYSLTGPPSVQALKRSGSWAVATATPESSKPIPTQKSANALTAPTAPRRRVRVRSSSTTGSGAPARRLTPGQAEEAEEQERQEGRLLPQDVRHAGGDAGEDGELEALVGVARQARIAHRAE